MATAPSSKPLTADQFFRLPEPEHGGKMELVDGEVVVMSPVNPEHGRTAFLIARALDDFAAPHHLGEIDVETGYRLRRKPDLVRAPGVSFVTESRRAAGQARRTYFDGPPDLAVEVKSPDDREADLLRKVGEYLDAGCARVWVVRPARKTVTVYTPEGARTLGESASLDSGDAGFSVAGFELPVAQIFAS